MEKYRAALNPPLPELTPATAAAIGGSSRRRENHKKSVYSERERRVQMSDMYSALISVVPNLPLKTTREQIVAGTIDYIKSLERERERLECFKKSLLPPRPALSRCCSSGSSAVEVKVSDHGVVFFGIRLFFRRRLATEVFRVFKKHGAEVLAASVSVDGSGGGGKVLAVAVTAAVGGGGDTVEMIRRELTNL